MRRWPALGDALAFGDAFDASAAMDQVQKVRWAVSAMADGLPQTSA